MFVYVIDSHSRLAREHTGVFTSFNGDCTDKGKQFMNERSEKAFGGDV